MSLTYILTLISSISFLGYGIAYLVSTKMKSEFKRFGLEKIGTLTAVLELLGATGLLVGLQSNILLLISSAGLGLLMFFALLVRIRVKDSLFVSIPAISYFIINATIFYQCIILF